MKWLYESRFYKWLDADPERWEWYGIILLITSWIAFGLVMWWIQK